MEVPSLEEYKEKYHMIDKIVYSSQLDEYLEERNPSIIYQNYGINSDSNLETCVLLESDFKTDDQMMHNVLCESRVVKTKEEIEIMRWASKITCEGHKQVMKNVKPG